MQVDYDQRPERFKLPSPPALGPIVYTRRRVGRNERCPFCTSGRKFKVCHGASIPTECLMTAAGHAQEQPAAFVCTLTTPKGPRPAMRERLS